MAGLQRITQPTLDVLEVLLRAHKDGEKIHGWAIMKQTKRSGPTVYSALDRLEDAGWITGEWEELDPDANRPRRRFYQLTGEGAPAARALLTERRSATLKTKPSFGFSALAQFRTLLAGG
ncbi:PadR family transcriptional regulator [Nonomuraea sp. NPDC049784]|uniref:PadR family transcriptional regulator n=1 Tax=Nonomuraea sp. NPDC049784 TaxID=3154361 RepID=UPI0033D95E94